MTDFSAGKNDFFPPITKRIAVKDTVHGFVMTDFYRWLEDKDSPKVRDWSEQQHEFTIEYINRTAKEIPGLRDEIRAYLDREYTGAPFFEGKRKFFMKRKKGEQQNKLYTEIDGKELLIFDPEQFDESGKSAITGMDFTQDGEKAAIGLQYKGNEISDYRVIDTRTGEVLGDVIKGLAGFSWTKDEEHAYLSLRTREMIEKQTPLPVYLHKIGDDRKNDKFLVAPDDAKNFASVGDAEESDVTFFNEGDFYSNSLKIREAGSNDEPKLIYQSGEFSAYPYAKGDRIYFFTNYEAPNFKIMIADKDNPEFENWKEFYPEKETVLEGYVVTEDYVIVRYKKDVLTRLAVYDLDGKFIRELKTPELGDVAGLSYHKETNNVYVSLSTYSAPSKVYRLDGESLEWEFFFQDKPPVDTEDIESKQVFYYSKDSTRVSMFIVYKKGIQLDGRNPTILYGYGGFNYSLKPRFIGTAASFINRGGVYAFANIRGGDEYGENWHRGGMLKNKQNTFDDFIAAAEYLIEKDYTNPNHLAIKGASNGGLLTGAVALQRPDLFKVAYIGVPLLDMLRYHKFLIARYWIPEYGDPDVKDDFLYLLKYSPYHNIRTGIGYPAMFIKAGENDARVDPLHAKKFAAALQGHPAQINPVLLYVDFESGHGSGQSIEQLVDNVEIEWRWMMRQLGI